MDDGGARRIIPIVFILVIIAVAIAAIVSIGQAIFGGEGQPEEVNQGKRSLVNTDEDRAVRMVVRGPIVGDEKYYSYSITVKPGSRNLTTYNGYLNRQLEVQDLGNNIPAYEQFVYALDRAGMMDAKEFSGDENDVRGLCATGRVITFETLRGTSVIKSLWTSTCNNGSGSLKTEYIRLQNLFKAQMPDYLKALGKLRIE